MSEKSINGVLILSDRGLFFISDKNLERFKVPDAEARPALKIIDDNGPLHLGKLSANVSVIAALKGPLGSRAGDLDWNAAAINPTIPDRIKVKNLERTS